MVRRSVLERVRTQQVDVRCVNVFVELQIPNTFFTFYAFFIHRLFYFVAVNLFLRLLGFWLLDFPVVNWRLLTSKINFMIFLNYF